MRRSASWFKRSNPKLLVNTVYTEFLSPSLPPSSILLNKLYFGTIVDLLIHQSCREFVYLLLRYKYFLNTFDASGTFWACGIQRQNCVSLLLEDHRDCETEWTSNSTHTSDTKRVWVFSSYRLILQLCGDQLDVQNNWVLTQTALESGQIPRLRNRQVDKTHKATGGERGMEPLCPL